MEYNNNLRKKLLTNIYSVIFFIVIGGIFAGIKLYQIYGQELTIIEVQGVLILKDYLAFLYVGYGVMALISSVLVYFFFDLLAPHNQVRLFIGVGVLFLPFTIILVVLGIMKYLEKSKFIGSLVVSAIVGFSILSFVTSATLSDLSEIEAQYLNEYIFELEHVISDEEVVQITITVLSRGTQIEKVSIDSLLNIDEPNHTYIIGEFIRLSVSGEPLCLNYPYEDALVDLSLSCEITQFTGAYADLSTYRFVNYTEFYLEIGYIDNEFVIHEEPSIGSEMEVLSVTYIENIYDQD